MTTATRHAGVWDTLVGQRRAIEALRTAAAGHGMSQALLFTGPPGSGRSNAAIAFAAALQCEEQPRRAAAPATRATPCWPARHADVTRGPHRAALDRRRRGARPGPPLGPGAGRPPVADHDRRGRRPADRAGRQRPAQGDRGAHRPHRLDALRAHRRGRAAHHPLALPAGHPDHAVDRRGRRLPGPHATASTPPSRRTARGPARATSAGPGRWPATRPPATAATRSSAWPARLTSLGACMNAAANLGEMTQEEADAITGDLDAARARRPRRVVRRGGAWTPARASTPRPWPRWRRSQKDAGQASPPRRRRPRPDGPGLGLPRRDRAGHRRR